LQDLTPQDLNNGLAAAFSGKRIPSREVLNSLLDEYKYLVTKVVQIGLAVGATTGLSMTILFRQGWDDPDVKLNSVRIEVAFILFALALGIFVGVPSFRAVKKVYTALAAHSVSSVAT